MPPSVPLAQCRGTSWLAPPDRQGHVDRDGVRVGYEVFGSEHGDPTVLLMPGWAIAHSHVYRAQVPYLSRFFRVVTVDPRGNGRSDRPKEKAAYHLLAYSGDISAVLDAVGARSAYIVGLSMGGLWGTLAAAADRRIERAVFIGPAFPVTGTNPDFWEVDFLSPRDSYEGPYRYNVNHWREDYAGFVEHFARLAVPEPHSTRSYEDGLAMGMETDAETLAATLAAPDGVTRVCDAFAGAADGLRAVAAGMSIPTLVIHGSRDAITPIEWGEALADASRGELMVIDGAGHLPQGREPVAVNLALREFFG